MSVEQMEEALGSAGCILHLAYNAMIIILVVVMMMTMMMVE